MGRRSLFGNRERHHRRSNSGQTTGQSTFSSYDEASTTSQQQQHPSPSLAHTLQRAELDLRASLEFLEQQHLENSTVAGRSLYSEDPSHRLDDLQRRLQQAEREFGGGDRGSIGGSSQTRVHSPHSSAGLVSVSETAVDEGGGDLHEVNIVGVTNSPLSSASSLAIPALPRDGSAEEERSGAAPEDEDDNISLASSTLSRSASWLSHLWGTAPGPPSRRHPQQLSTLDESSEASPIVMLETEAEIPAMLKQHQEELDELHDHLRDEPLRDDSSRTDYDDDLHSTLFSVHSGAAGGGGKGGKYPQGLDDLQRDLALVDAAFQQKPGHAETIDMPCILEHGDDPSYDYDYDAAAAATAAAGYRLQAQTAENVLDDDGTMSVDMVSVLTSDSMLPNSPSQKTKRIKDEIQPPRVWIEPAIIEISTPACVAASQGREDGAGVKLNHLPTSEHHLPQPQPMKGCPLPPQHHPLNEKEEDSRPPQSSRTPSQTEKQQGNPRASPRSVVSIFQLGGDSAHDSKPTGRVTSAQEPERNMVSPEVLHTSAEHLEAPLYVAPARMQQGSQPDCEVAPKGPIERLSLDQDQNDSRNNSEMAVDDTHTERVVLGSTSAATTVIGDTREQAEKGSVTLKNHPNRSPSGDETAQSAMKSRRFLSSLRNQLRQKQQQPPATQQQHSRNPVVSKTLLTGSAQPVTMNLELGEGALPEDASSGAQGDGVPLADVMKTENLAHDITANGSVNSAGPKVSGDGDNTASVSGLFGWILGGNGQKEQDGEPVVAEGRFSSIKSGVVATSILSTSSGADQKSSFEVERETKDGVISSHASDRANLAPTVAASETRCDGVSASDGGPTSDNYDHNHKTSVSSYVASPDNDPSKSMATQSTTPDAVSQGAAMESKSILSSASIQIGGHVVSTGAGQCNDVAHGDGELPEATAIPVSCEDGMAAGTEKQSRDTVDAQSEPLPSSGNPLMSAISFFSTAAMSQLLVFTAAADGETTTAKSSSGDTEENEKGHASQSPFTDSEGESDDDCDNDDLLNDGSKVAGGLISSPKKEAAGAPAREAMQRVTGEKEKDTKRPTQKDKPDSAPVKRRHCCQCVPCRAG